MRANVIPGWSAESVFTFRFEARRTLVGKSRHRLLPGESPAHEEKTTDFVRGRAGSSPQETAREETSPPRLIRRARRLQGQMIRFEWAQ
jgi:hypothetical protein